MISGIHEGAGKRVNSVKSLISVVLHRAAADADFRGRLVRHLGNTLAEEGFILDDEEMRAIREMIEPLDGLTDRIVYERVSALSRRNPR